MFLCPGYHDYIKLVNSKGGVGGHKIRVIEIDHEYKVPQAVKGYQLFKKEGAVLVGLYGTPQTQAQTQALTQALTQRLTEVGGRRSYRDVKHYRRRKRWLS